MTVDQSSFAELEKRISRDHLAKRLERQVNHSALQFTGSSFKFHWENFEPTFVALRVILKALGLFKRGMQNAVDYRVEKKDVFLKNLPPCFSGFTILQISDIHIDGISDHGQRLREIIQTLHFNLCAITGDFRFMTFYDYENAMADMETLAGSLQCEHGVVSILGNHDFIEMVPFLEAMGIQVLLNEAVAIERNQETIWIAGVDDSHFYQVHDLSKALGVIPPDNFKILMAHSPELLAEAARAGVQYYLSGTYPWRPDLPALGHPHSHQRRMPQEICQRVVEIPRYGGVHLQGNWIIRTACPVFLPSGNHLAHVAWH